MKILKAGTMYGQWVNTNTNATDSDKLIARTLLATNDVSATLFITEASFNQITRIYNSLNDENLINVEDTHIKTMASSEGVHQLPSDETDVNSRKRLDRKKVVSYVTSRIVEGNPGAKVLKVRYNTMEVKLANGTTVKVKIATSRDYHGPEYLPQKYCCSWHKELDQHLSEYDHHVYVVECGDSYKALIFTTSEIKAHLLKKSYNDNFVNYYFHWNPNNTITDEREPVPIDVTIYDADHNQWKLK